MPKPTPREEHPAWLKTLLGKSDEQLRALGISEQDLEDAEKGWLRESDYTTKTQAVAAVKKVMDANPGMNWEEAVQAYNWAKTEWPKWQRSHQELEGQVRTLSSAPKATPASASDTPRTFKRGKVVSEITAEDLYETSKLRERFGDLENEVIGSAVDAAFTRVKDDWYTKEEMPRLDKVAAGYLGTVINLMRPIWRQTFGDKGPDIDTLLREAAAQQNPDLVAVFDGLLKKTATTTETGFNDGFKKGEQEAEKRLREQFGLPKEGGPATNGSAGTTGPLSGTTPAWKAPERKGPLTRDQLAAAVLGTVEKKHGPLPR